MRTKKLLFFFSDEQCSSCATVVPTLSALADEMGYDFESYICARPLSWQGKVLPTVGHNHIEQFYYLANFYEEILYCSISSYGSFQFRREVLAFGGSVISARKDDEVFAFYKDVFSFFGKPLPDTAVVIADYDVNKNYNISAYCYCDIKRIGGLGISESAWNRQEKLFRENGVEKCVAFYCSPQGAEIIDSIGEEDDYASLTTRIAERNIGNAKQIGFIDPPCLLRWQTDFCRRGVLSLYERDAWEAFMPTVKKYSDQIGNKMVIGSQNVTDPNTGDLISNDDVIAELGKYHLIQNMVGINPRLGFTIQSKNKLPLDWLEDDTVPTCWDQEYSDEFLIKKIEERAVPVCFVFYAADLGHIPVLSNFINMMCLDDMRGGICFPSTWYDYQPELLEQLYIPLEQGGVCPNLEPMISSVGVAVATEAKGFIEGDFLKELIQKAKDDIEAEVGARRVPKGYYPWQDANPYYRGSTGEPQYDVMSELGFEYYITQKNYNQPASIEYEGNGMTVMNQQTRPWFPSSGEPLAYLKEWENKTLEKRKAWKAGGEYGNVDWITLSVDTPFYGLTPNYLGQIEDVDSRFDWACNAGMYHLYDAIQYVRCGGGADGNLFLVKPHELYRFAKLANERGLVNRNYE